MLYLELIKVFRKGDRDECAQLLNTEGIDIDINIKDYGYLSRSLTHWACFHGHLDIIQLLLTKGANIHDKNSSGWSLIMEASRNGLIEIVEFLVNQGANINSIDNYGWNSLMLATARSNTNIIEFLLVQGAGIHHKTLSGKTCIDIAINEAKDENIKSILVNWPIMMVIIVFEELNIYNQLDDSLLDLQEYL